MWYVVGLGNPGEEYKETRHNTGRIVLDIFARASEGKLGKEKVTLLAPDTFMNKSGEALRGKITSKKAAERLVVIHDDLDIPFGSYKISFNKSSGGHRGVESIIKAIKTQAFVRVRVGIASSAAVVKKSQDDKTVEKVILGKFTPDQMTALKKLAKKIAEGIIVLITEGREKAMSQYHA